MEAVMQRWEEAETEAEEEEGLLQRQAHMQINIDATTNVDIQGLEFSQTKVNSGDEEWDVSAENHSVKTEYIEKNIGLPATGPSVNETEGETVVVSMEYGQGVHELYLDSVCQKPPTHGFYCPECKVCIEKVLIQKMAWKEPSFHEPPRPSNPPRCPSCLSFLIPIGRVLFPGLTCIKDVESNHEDSKPKPDVSEDSKQQPLTGAVGVDEADTVQEPGSIKAWEILKSIVYGGLIEFIASLSVVTSAASGGATTLNIVALSIANLVGGLFILVHNIWDLKPESPSSSNQIDTSADRYYQSLGHEKNFFLHLSVAILSFLIFGLVPPLVYGFSFYGSNSTDLKLAAVAGASVICVTLLAVAKAYIQRPTAYRTYFKTVFYYLSTGAVASVLAYLVGELVKKLVEKLGWFESSSSLNLFLI